MTCMANLVIVAEDEISVGFKLAGVEEVYTDSSKVKEALDRKDVAVLVLTKQIFGLIDELTQERLKDSKRPSVVILDDSEESMNALVKLTTGIEIGE